MDAPNPDFADVVRAVLLSLPAAASLGVEVSSLAPGSAELHLPVRREHTQHDGAVAGSVLGALADFAGGAAVGTLLPAGWMPLTADYTVKLLAPTVSDRVVARGRVVNLGRSSAVAAVDVLTVVGTAETLCATALVTMRNVELRSRRDPGPGP